MHAPRRGALIALALVVPGGCAARVTTARTAVAIADDETGALPSATPREATSDHAETGAPARVVLGARRERAGELFARFIRAMARRDVAGLTAMMDTSVYDLERAETLPREALAAEIETVLSRFDPSQLLALAGGRLVVRSSAEMRRLGRSYRFSTERDDWFVESSFRGGPINMAGPLVPRTVMVRFLGDDPVIEGLSLPLRNR